MTFLLCGYGPMRSFCLAPQGSPMLSASNRLTLRRLVSSAGDTDSAKVAAYQTPLLPSASTGQLEAVIAPLASDRVTTTPRRSSTKAWSSASIVLAGS